MAKLHHKTSVIRTLAASNKWLIGMLLVLLGVVFVALYTYSTYKSVKGIETQAAETKDTISTDSSHLSNGCFVLKGNLSVVESCGNGLYRYVHYSCGDNTKIILGSAKSCQSVANWLSTVATSCKGHTSCDGKNPLTPKVSDRSLPSPKS